MKLTKIQTIIVFGLILIISNSMIACYQNADTFEMVRVTSKAKATAKLLMKRGKEIDDLNTKWKTLEALPDTIKNAPNAAKLAEMNRFTVILKAKIKLFGNVKISEDYKVLLNKIKTAIANSTSPKKIEVKSDFDNLWGNVIGTKEEMKAFIVKAEADSTKNEADTKAQIAVVKQRKDQLELLTASANLSEEDAKKSSNLDAVTKVQGEISVSQKFLGAAFSSYNAKTKDLACKRALAEAVPPKFCWRAGGQKIPECPIGYFLSGLLCYENCAEDRVFFGGFCRLKCNADETVMPETCHKSWFSLRSRDATFSKIQSMFSGDTTCPASHTNKIGALCYRKCPPGSVNCGCCACAQNTKTCAFYIAKMIYNTTAGLLNVVSTLVGAGNILNSDPVTHVKGIVTAVIASVISISDEILSLISLTKSTYKTVPVFAKRVVSIGKNRYFSPALTTAELQDFTTTCTKSVQDQWDAWGPGISPSDDDVNGVIKDSFITVYSAKLGFVPITDQISQGSVFYAISSILPTIQQMKDSSGSDTENVTTAINILNAVEGFDSTGITTLALGFLHPKCLDDPIYDTRKFRK